MTYSLAIFSLFTAVSMGMGFQGLAADKPCEQDMKKFCKDVKPGGGRILKCLKEHESELSAECREKGQQAKAKMQEAIKECKEDIGKFCGDIAPGGGNIAKCLGKNRDKLSAGCQAALKP